MSDKCFKPPATEKQFIDLYAPGNLSEEAYVHGNIELDKQLHELKRENNPFWLFYSSNEPFDRLSQFKGKRIAVGPVGSGTRSSAEQVLGKAGVNSENAAFVPFAGSSAVEALNDGKVDAMWILGAPDATSVHSLLQNPNVRIMSFPTAEAFTIIFPELVRLVMPRGVTDIDRDIPPTDVPLIGSTAKVLVRSDLHPEIVQLLLQTMVEAHGARAIFQRSGEFPNSTDTEYPVAPAAIDFIRTVLRSCKGICLCGYPSTYRERSPCW